MPEFSNTHTVEAMIEVMAKISEHASYAKIGNEAGVNYGTVKKWPTKREQGEIPRMNPNYVENWFRPDNPLRTGFTEEKPAAIAPSA